MMNKKGMIIILEAKSFFIPFSKALQKRGARARVIEEREREEKKVSGRTRGMNIVLHIKDKLQLVNNAKPRHCTAVLQ